MCVAPAVQVPVSLPLSVDIPLPYQLVRGEQLELRGSVYNQQADGVMVTSVTVLLFRIESIVLFALFEAFLWIKEKFQLVTVGDSDLNV